MYLATKGAGRVLAGDEAEREPWARLNRDLAGICLRRMHSFFRIKKEQQ